ncbi:MAG: HAD-IG family 5'-nucleotidase, partial [Planctomycetota bacterium]
VAAESPDRQQFPWWYDLVSSTVRSPAVDTRHAIFTNRSLRFDRIKAVGFDFDHTLAIYNSSAIDAQAMDLVIERLKRHERIPASHFENLPAAHFARKGLIVDIELGNVLKTDRYGHVLHAHRGREKLKPAEKRRIYGDSDVIPNVSEGQRFLQVDSAFSQPEVILFAGLAPRMKDGGCRRLWRKLRAHTDKVHRDGSLKNILTRSPGDYLEHDPLTEPMLRHLRAGGKKVFLLTNSEWEYTRAMINPTLSNREGEDLQWLHLFDEVVVEAGKPGYFNPRKGAPKAECVGPAKVYRGGNIDDLETRLGCGGPEILYVGDHIYSDLISSKRRQSWRTMLVIGELEDELKVQSMLPGVVQQLKGADERRTATEREVQHWRAVEAALDRLRDPDHREMVKRLKTDCAESRKKALDALKEYIQQRERLRGKISNATNPYWGSLFRAGNELTYFGRQIEDFACTYTSRATNLIYYDPKHYFRSAMDYLPHELETM